MLASARLLAKAAPWVLNSEMILNFKNETLREWPIQKIIDESLYTVHSVEPRIYFLSYIFSIMIITILTNTDISPLVYLFHPKK